MHTYICTCTYIDDVHIIITCFLTQHESVPIKMNMAAILREGARVHKEEDALLKRLAGLEAGEKDDSDFLRWQEEVKQVIEFETCSSGV